MTPLALRQASALVWLRAMLSWRRAKERALSRFLLAVLGLLVAGAGSLGTAALVLASSEELIRSPAELAHRGGPLAMFATWLALALVVRLWFSLGALGGAGPFLDPRRFLPYAVPARVVSGINFIAALRDENLFL